jgi:hypothetical protein
MAWRVYRKPLLGVTTLAVAFGFVFVAYQRAPSYTFNPFCANDLTYRLNVTIAVAGQQYSSQVVSQTSHARTWLAAINGGCAQTRGTALSFRLADNRVVLIDSHICPKARRAMVDTPNDHEYVDVYAQAMQEHRKVDLSSFCIGVRRDQQPTVVQFIGNDGFVIGNADNPTRWKGFMLDNASAYPEEHRVLTCLKRPSGRNA